MKKIIINQKTLMRTQNELRLAYKEVYLRIQRALINSLGWDIPKEEKKEITKMIVDTGKIYQTTYQNQQKPGKWQKTTPQN